MLTETTGKKEEICENIINVSKNTDHVPSLLSNKPKACFKQRASTIDRALNEVHRLILVNSMTNKTSEAERGLISH